MPRFDTKGRVWKTRPNVYWYNGRIYFAIEKLITHYAWREEQPEPRVIQDIAFALALDPRKWKVERVHIYYDGPHCAWAFGPFLVIQSWFWCKSCMPG